MTWATGVQDAPRLRNYAEAIAHEKKVIPIRRRVPECKPLGRRDCTGLTIRKEGRSIVVQMWGTNITYRPNGNIEIGISHSHSNSTNTLIRRLLGTHVRGHDNKVWIQADDPANTTRAPGTQVYPMREKREKATPKRRWVRTTYTATIRGVDMSVQEHSSYSRYACYYQRVDPIKYPKSHRVDRRAASEARRRYASFLSFLRGYVKLVDVNDLKRTYSGLYGEDNKTLIATMRSGSPEAQAALAKTLVGANIDVKYIWTARAYVNSINTNAVFRSADSIIMREHRNTVFVTTTHTEGRFTKDRYHHYFR